MTLVLSLFRVEISSSRMTHSFEGGLKDWSRYTFVVFSQNFPEQFSSLGTWFHPCSLISLFGDPFLELRRLPL